MNTRDRDNFLIRIMNSGFDKAAVSFSKFVNREVKIVNSQSLLIKQDNFSYMSEEQGELYVLVTQMIGEISGKSFLIFSQDESQEIFRALNTSVSNDALKEAFLMEIDNIISASVIAEISNKLAIEIYGDVPHLLKVNSKDLQPFLSTEMTSEDNSSIIFSNTTFQFDKKDKIHPQFIWKISSKIFDMISADKITA